jgi:hypothetical protein
MNETLKNCRNCHWWIPIEHVGDTGSCRRFPPSVVPDYTLKKIKMISGKPKTLIDALNDAHGVFPMTAGSTWCGEWTDQRQSEQRQCERELLREEEVKREQEVEKFVKRLPGELHRIMPREIP